MSRPWLRFLVPRDWTGGQALLAATVLRNAMDAIWAVHGEEIAYALGQRSPTRWSEALPHVDDLIDEDDIPY